MGFFYSQFFIKPEYPTQSFAGQRVIITGSNVGLGLEAARHIVRLQAAQSILAVRNLDAGEAAKRLIEQSTGRPGVCQVWHLDLASFASVQNFADRVARLPRVDCVVANAAIATPSFKVAEGHERTITINVISTMLLAVLILPKLRETAKHYPESTPRHTVVVSETHAWTPFPEWKSSNTFQALKDMENADMENRYSTSKLMEILLLREMVVRMSGSGVIINIVNPGLCHSKLAREIGWGFWMFKRLVARSTEVGSRTLVAGASAGRDSHGMYMTDGRVSDEALSDFVHSSEGKQAQKKLWREIAGILEGIHPGIMQKV